MVKKRLKFSKKHLLLLGVAAVAIGLVVFFANRPSPTNQPIPTKDTAGSTPNGGSTQTIPTTNDKLPAGSSNTSNNSAQSGSTTSKNVLTPSGAFVSNHRPSLSGSAEQRQEQSVCYTTAGISCYIEFTKNGEKRTLPTKTTDSSGYAYWTWDVKDSGFSSGSWQIKAAAGSGDQTKTATDSLALEVQP